MKEGLLTFFFLFLIIYTIFSIYINILVNNLEKDIGDKYGKIEKNKEKSRLGKYNVL